MNHLKQLVALPLLVALTLPAQAGESIADLKAKIAKLEAQVTAHKAERKQTARHLEIFDELDLVAFNNRDMKRIGEIHAENVIVYNPDGTKTSPYPPHEEELQFLFDTFNFKVAKHIVGFGHGEWTAGISVSDGEFQASCRLS